MQLPFGGAWCVTLLKGEGGCVGGRGVIVGRLLQTAIFFFLEEAKIN